MSKKLKKYVAALGEHTGHSHVFKATKTDAYLEAVKSRVVEDAHSVVAEIIARKAPATLTHEEHSGMLFMPNVKYVQKQMREIDPFTNEMRAVMD